MSIKIESIPPTQHVILSKAVKAQNRRIVTDDNGDVKVVSPDMAYLNRTAVGTAQKIKDIDTIIRLLPDTGLAIQIILSSILSPKDMGTPELKFDLDNPAKFGEAGTKMLSVVRDYFTNDHKINDELYRMLEEIKFTRGAHIRLTLPETAVDKLINGDAFLTKEDISHAISHTEGLGLLDIPDDSDVMTLESIYNIVESTPVSKVNVIGDDLVLVDNPDNLKLSALQERVRIQREFDAVSKYMNYSEESRKQMFGKFIKEIKGKKADNAMEIIEKWRDRGNADQYEPTVEIEPTTLGQSSGYAFDVKIPMGCCIPAYIGEPDNHVGYFLLTDQNGQWINPTTQLLGMHKKIAHHIETLSGNATTHSSELDKFMSDVTGGMMNANTGGDINMMVKQVIDSFTSKVEKQLFRSVRLKKEDTISLGQANEIYQVMLARTLAKKKTQIVYVPKQFVTYMAFEYDESGIGKSLLDDVLHIASMRAVLMVANARAAVKNATTRTTYDVKLDPDDKNAAKRISQIKGSIMESRANDFPMYMTDLGDINSVLRDSSVDFIYSGNNGLPDMSIQASENTTNYAEVNRELDEQWADWMYMKMGVSPEVVDMSRGAQFATSVVFESLMMAKRVLQDQLKFESAVGQYIRKFTRYSEPLYRMILAAGKGMKTDYIPDKHTSDLTKSKSKTDITDEFVITEFVNALRVKLPRPDTVTLDAQLQSLSTIEDALDKIIAYYISEDLTIEEFDGNNTRDLEQLSRQIKAHCVRQYVKRNGIMPELTELFDINSEGESDYDIGTIAATHANQIMKALGSYPEVLAKAEEKAAERRIKVSKEQAERVAKLAKRLKVAEEVAKAAMEGDENPMSADPGSDDMGDSAPDEDTGDDTEDEDTGDEADEDAEEDDAPEDDEDDDTVAEI